MNHLLGKQFTYVTNYFIWKTTKKKQSKCCLVHLWLELKGLKHQAKRVADDILFVFIFGLDILCELSAWHMIHVKCQLIYMKKKKKEIF